MLLPLLPGTLPVGVCFTGPSAEQERLNAYMAASNAVLEAGQSFYNFGDSPPSVANQAYPWLRTTDGRWYTFSGKWIAPTNYSIFERRLFIGTLDDLKTYDGGDTGSAGPTSGPMWEEDPEFVGRVPIGPGLIPATAPALTIDVATDGGEGGHTQTIAEMPAHNHPPDPTLSDGYLGHAVTPGSFNVTSSSNDTIKLGTTGNTGGGTPFNLVQPVRGCYIVRWTHRLYYAV